jgi:hypothetical protein
MPTEKARSDLIPLDVISYPRQNRPASDQRCGSLNGSDPPRKTRPTIIKQSGTAP